MHARSLQSFVRRVSEAKRLSFADLRRLQRDVLPDGPVTREEIGALVAIEQAIAKCDGGWPDYLLESILTYLASARDIDAETLWLASVLAALPERSAQAIARAVASEYPAANEALRALGRGTRRKRAAACATGLSAETVSAPLDPVPIGTLSVTWGHVRLGAALKLGAGEPDS